MSQMPDQTAMYPQLEDMDFETIAPSGMPIVPNGGVFGLPISMNTALMIVGGAALLLLVTMPEGRRR